MSELKPLYEALKAIQGQLSKRTSGEAVDNKFVNQVMRLYNQIEALRPGLLPWFEPREFHRFGEYYEVDSLAMQVAIDIPTVKAAVLDEPIPVALDSEDFLFVDNTDLRNIAVRDFNELRSAIVTESWKTIVVLAGSLIENLLLDLLLRDKDAALADGDAPARKKIERWDLVNLITVSANLGKLPKGVEKLSQSVREYRNLIHPGREITTDLKVEPEEGKIAVEVFKILIREMKKMH